MALENAKEQSKEPNEAGCTPLGGIRSGEQKVL